MKHGGKVIIAAVMSTLILGLTGCPEKEGPVERAGKSVDKAMDKAGEQIEQAGKNVQDAAKGDNK